MRYLVVVERGPTSFGAYVPDLPGCVAAGATKAGALKLIRKAIELHISDLNSEGREVPQPTSVSGVVELDIGFLGSLGSACQQHNQHRAGGCKPRSQLETRAV